MPAVDTLLRGVLDDLVENGAGVKEPLAGHLRCAASAKALSLSLESMHGALLSVGTVPVTAATIERNMRALPALSDNVPREKRFFFSMTDRRWDVLSSFTVDTLPFFTKISLDITLPQSAPLRAGLFKLADFITVKCRDVLQSFVNDCLRIPPAVTDAGCAPAVIGKLVAFSQEVQCAVLLDHGGCVLHAAGSAMVVDELAGSLAHLFHRGVGEIARLDRTELTAITLADHEYTVRIGRVAGTSLVLAVMAGGHYSGAYAHFLHTTAARVFAVYAAKNGKLCGTAVDEPVPADGIRTSWLEPRLPVSGGHYVTIQRTALFHTPECPVVKETKAVSLHWFTTRDEAVAGGLHPCTTCNP